MEHNINQQFKGSNPLDITSINTNHLSETEKEKLFHFAEEYGNNVLNEYESEFEELELGENYQEKRTVLDFGVLESADAYGDPELIHSELMPDKAFEDMPDYYHKFIDELDHYIARSDENYYVDMNTGHINDSHLTLAGGKIIQSVDEYPANEAFNNYLPVAIAKGMATNQITSSNGILKELPEILGEHQYEVFKKELEYIEKEYSKPIVFMEGTNVVQFIKPYQGLYNDSSSNSNMVVNDIDLKYRGVIYQYDVEKDRQTRPIGAAITDGITSEDYGIGEENEQAANLLKSFETTLNTKEREKFKEAYLSVKEVLEHPNSGLNYTKYDKHTQQMMESYHRLKSNGELSDNITVSTMADIIKYTMEKNLAKELEQRAEKSLQQESSTPKISISKPKGNNGLER